MWWLIAGIAIGSASSGPSCDDDCRQRHIDAKTAHYDDMKCRGKAGWILDRKIAVEPPSRPCPKKGEKQ